jgi:Cysteine-rich secretory protein family
LIILVVIQVIILLPKADDRILGISIDLEAWQINKLVNQARQKHELPPLSIDSKLQIAALEKANDMLRFAYWDHFSPAKRTPWKFILDAGYNYRFAGENLAKDFADEEDLVQAWLDSPPHRANLLSDKYVDTGIAVVIGELDGQQVILVVQMFGTPFTQGEIDLLNKQGGNIVFNDEHISTPILSQSGISKNSLINSEQFLLSKALASILIFILMILLSVNILKGLEKQHFRKKAKKFWGVF